MKQLIIISFLFFSLSSLRADNRVLLKYSTDYKQQVILPDTTIIDDVKANTALEDIIKSTTIPAKEKVQYVSQVTRYGFKNLFSNYAYNPAQPYNAQINSNAIGFVDDYIQSHGKFLQNMKGWGQPYFNLIEGILMQYGLPKELKYIAVIESDLKSGAISNKGACGPWQLMPGTARDLGLSCNSYVDDRTDYYKSTHAAARYLLKAYSIFHDWLLVMAAYNGGPGRVFEAIRKSGSRDFWNLQYYLPEQSRTYVKRFIATHYIMEGNGGITTMVNPNSGLGINTSLPGVNPYDNKPILTTEEEETMETQTLTGKYNSIVIAKNLSMDIIQFNRFNPDFDNLLSAKGNYDLRLPADKMQLFMANRYPILNECVQLLFANDNIPGNRQTFYPNKRVKIKVKNKH